MESINLIATMEDVGQRLDVYLTTQLPDYSRSFFQNLIKQDHIFVGGRPAKANHRIKAADDILITIPPAREVHITPENIDLDIVYQDKDIVVINKPQGMVVHPAVGNYTGTLVNALLYHCTELSGINGEIRPGIVHRIDKDTSGLLVVAKNDFAHRSLAQQIREKSASRVYQAIVENNFKEDSGTVKANIGRHPVERKKMAVVNSGRIAVTHYKVLERFGIYNLLELSLETGRTHQIRVHMSYIGHPILGDPLYGSHNQKFTLKGQALHAVKLVLDHPRTGEHMTFFAPLPDYFEKLIEILRIRSKNN